MLFNSLHFVFFLPLVIALFYLIPHRYRWVMLLVASYYFYMAWKAEYALLILTSTIVDYFAALEMEKLSSKKDKRVWLIVSLVTNLGLLFIFKYFNFVSQSTQSLINVFDIGVNLPVLDLLLPVGISFYTFQTLSYSIDVYYGRQVAEKHFGYFALYVSYFPQLVAGPIERHHRLAPQLRQKHAFEYDNLVNGLRLILYGLFIKMVIADNLAVYVDQVYQSPESYGKVDILTSWFFYSFQIYSDFYGYSLIAIGSALMMGVKIIDNFKTPYLSRSISEFWQRWHISLSTWFRDYLYFPLGGNRRSRKRWFFNIVVVFLISGIWHGANWTFVFWGGVFALFYLLEKTFAKSSNISNHKGFNLNQLFKVLLTFIIVCVAWVFFRSPSISEAFQMIGLLFQNQTVQTELHIKPVVWIMLGFFILSDIVLYNSRFDKFLAKLSWPLRWLNYAFLIFAIIVFAAVEHIPFIYFQF